MQSWKANTAFFLNSGILGSSYFSSVEMHVKILALVVLLINNCRHNSLLRKNVVLHGA